MRFHHNMFDDDGGEGSLDVSSSHDSAPRLINEPLPIASSYGAAHSKYRPFKLAIACMTKRPSNFVTWLTYHKEVAGVQHFYLRVEDTPALETFLSKPPWDTLCTVTAAQSTVRDWGGQTRRQMTHVTFSIRKAVAAGYTHLMHLDDDELLYLPHGVNALESSVCHLSPSIADLHALNLEALAPSVNCQNPFAECVAFKHRPNDYCAYGVGPNSRGKSMGALVHPDLRPRGPHHFAASYPAQASQTHVLPPQVAVVLHYESCRYERWRDKFTDYARRMSQEGQAAIALARRFTSFYRESISVCSQLQATRGGDANSDGISRSLLGLLGHYGRNDADEAAKAHWSSGKLEPTAAAELRGVVLDRGGVHTLGDPHHLTIFAPPARAVAARASVVKAERALDASASSAVESGVSIVLLPPRARRWRNVWHTMIIAREAPSMESRMVDLIPLAAELAVDAQTEDGEWLRLAKLYPDGQSGWILVNGTSYGYGLLLEPIEPQPSSEPSTAEVNSLRVASDAASRAPRHSMLPQPRERMPPHARIGTDAPRDTVAPSASVNVGSITLEALLSVADVPPECASRLLAAGLPSIIELPDGPQAVVEAARRAKLPLGHRLKLSLICKNGALDTAVDHGSSSPVDVH